MFTGIIESFGKIEKIEYEKTNIHFWLTVNFVHELKIDQSVAHNGVCLTVVELNSNQYKVTAIKETLDKTNLGNWKVGDFVNIERCMPANGRFDGHIVQGHIDETANCCFINDLEGSWEFGFTINSEKKHLIVDKGSICINGTSLTVASVDENQFTVCIIPYTYENTIFKYVSLGSKVNLEYDIVGKYVSKMLTTRI